jgi:hypothetical protein
MLLYTSPPEGLAWLPGSDKDWARHYTVTRGTAKHRDDEPARDDGTT